MTDSPAWDAGLMKLGPPEHIHAVGAFALYYNDLEMTLYTLFQHFVKLPADALGYLFITLNNRDRVNLVKKVAASDCDGVEIHAVEHAFKCFDICSENRNLLLHAIPTGHDANSITVAKPVTDKKGEVARYTFNLDQIREAAISAAKIADYVVALERSLIERAKMNPLTVGGRPPLPERPPLPRKLNLPPRGLGQ